MPIFGPSVGCICPVVSPPIPHNPIKTLNCVRCGPCSPTERDTVGLCGHISASYLDVGASRSSFRPIAVFAITRQISRLSTATIVFDVKRRSLTLFPVFAETGSSFQRTNGGRQDHIVLKSNRKSGTASSFMWPPPYFYFRFGRRR